MEVLRERKRGPSNDRFYGWYASMWAKSQYSCVCFFYSHVSFSSFGASTSGSSVWMWMGPLTSWPAHASFIAPMSPPPSPPVCSPMLKQVHHPVPPSSPPMSPSYIPLSSQCELNTSVLLFMFLLLMYLFFFSWCSNIWLFCLDVDGIHWPADFPWQPVAPAFFQALPLPGPQSCNMINLFVENEVTHHDTPVLVRTLSWRWVN